MSMVQKKLIFQIAVPGPFREPLDYLPPVDFQPTDNLLGMRIKVPLRNKEVIGILVGTQTHSKWPTDQLKRAIAVMDDKATLTPAIMKLTQWASQYYHCPIGEVMTAALPVALRQDKALAPYQKKLLAGIENTLPNTLIGEVTPPLNLDQENALTSITQHFDQFQAFLLYGVTGSGKTEVYLRAIEALLQQKKQVLVLIPEIGLTPQTFARFQQRFNVPIAVMHSGLTENEKLKAWLLAKENIAPIIIGTRSAIFTPIPNLGLIIIDEEHDLSFKQQEGFRYSARDLSLLRAQFENVPIVLGSATPSLESLHNAAQGRYQLLKLTERAGKAILPALKLIDLRKQKLTAGLSETLLKAMKVHLDQGNQVLIFLNRRGFAPSLLCHQCGFVAKCHRCDARLTYHQNPPLLRCHHCCHECAPYKACPDCGSEQWVMLGQGTQKIEAALQKLFPDHPVVRVDRDNTRRKHAMKELLTQIHQGEGKILVGTQMLAKGHHFPDVTLVAILDIDVGLSSSDFRATERMAQLVIQVAGRAGRASQPGEVLIQTHFPEHLLLNSLIKKGYLNFAEQALGERIDAHFPPYHYLALLRAEATQQVHPMNFLQEVATHARSLQSGISIMGPIPAPMEKRAGRFRAQLAFHAEKRSTLHHFLQNLLPFINEIKSAKKVRYALDVDPQDMM